MKELLEAGVHFGHQTKRWNPKMKEYIFGERNGIYIIDLQKTLKMFKEASKFVQDLAAEGKIVLFVGTKRQAQDAIAEEATRAVMFYVNQRWLGGLLTNWVTVQKSVKRLKELDEMATDGRYELLPKKEVIKLERERKHLQANLAGIKNMSRLPDAIFVIDSKISDSIVEGSQMATDKQSAELAAAVAQSAHDESAHETEGGEAGLDAGAEDISMEDVLGSGTKKAPAAEKEAADEVPQVESQTF